MKESVALAVCILLYHTSKGVLFIKMLITVEKKQATIILLITVKMWEQEYCYSSIMMIVAAGAGVGGGNDCGATNVEGFRLLNIVQMV